MNHEDKIKIGKARREMIEEMEICESALLFENPSYVSAIIGVSSNGRVVYDYDAMIEYLVNEESMSLDDAIDFLDYNSMRALDYADRSARPIVVYLFKGEDDE